MTEEFENKEPPKMVKDGPRIGKFLRGNIEYNIWHDRELYNQATKSWRQTHGCVIDEHGDILTNVGGQSNLYKSDRMCKDPTKELANARLMVSLQNSVERRCEIIEALLQRIDELEEMIKTISQGNDLVINND